MEKSDKGLPLRSQDYSAWYNSLVVKAGLAEVSSVRGCMVIRPYGFAIWEKLQGELDRRFKKEGIRNAYFPLLIPKSFFTREADHVKGFAKECAVVTHYRLKLDDEGRDIVVDPDSKLEEEYIIRPTSETIIWNTYRDWIHSYRDLPVICNQWCNVMRWEMRTRLFLRTAEFLWQEGHAAFATSDEADKWARRMLDLYADFCESFLDIPMVKGVKSETERFAGAVNTYTIEAMMQDGKALQSGTSHFLGQNFGKAFNVQYINKENTLDYPWAVSWGCSTRLMGALIMTHSDDKGLVLPPSIAPTQVGIVPIYKSDDDLEKIRTAVGPLLQELRGKGVVTHFDDDDKRRPGFKFAEMEMKGIPVRLAIGARDITNGTVEIVRRDTLEKQVVPMEGVGERIEETLKEMQANIFDKARRQRDSRICECNNYEEFKKRILKGGFFLCPWDGDAETEARIKKETQATIRCIPFGVCQEDCGVDMVSGKPAVARVLIARSY